VDIEIEFDGEHPLLLNPAINYSMDSAIYELCDMDVGDSYALCVSSQSLQPLFVSEGSKKAAAVHERKHQLTAYQEALLDPAIAAMVLTTPSEGILTRNKFYPTVK
jgi:hypothetical protein